MRPMRNVTTFGSCLAALALASGAHAEPRAYEVGRERGDVGISLSVPYSLGTHTEKVAGMSGGIVLDRASLRVVRGRLVVPISSIRSDDAQRDCHMREALGHHVCDGQNRLPLAGPDSAAFPDVSLDVHRGAAIDDYSVL